MALQITTPWLAQAMVGSNYSQTLVAVNGTAPYTWSLVNGSLPPGVTLTSGGVISGSPTSPGLYNLTAGVSDSNGLTATLPLSVTVEAAALTLNNAMADQFSNSYVDIPYCDLYWANHFNTTGAAAWAALSTNQKTSALLQACRIIETARFTSLKQLRAPMPLRYDKHSRLVMTLEDQPLPTKWLWTQRLQFPRNLDHDYVTGALYIPEPIMMAQCEQAVYSLTFDGTAIQNRMQGVVEDITTVGNIHLRQNYVQDGSEFAPRAMEMSRPYMLKSSYNVRRQ